VGQHSGDWALLLPESIYNSSVSWYCGVDWLNTVFPMPNEQNNEGPQRHNTKQGQRRRVGLRFDLLIIFPLIIELSREVSTWVPGDIKDAQGRSLVLL
jgi:hypothetical protein